MQHSLCAGRSTVAPVHVRSSSQSNFNVIATQGRINGRISESLGPSCHANEPKKSDCTISADQTIPAVGATELPTQGDSAVAGIDPIDYINKQLQDILKPPSTEDYLAVSVASGELPSTKPLCLLLCSHFAPFQPLQEFLAIQSNHPRSIGFFGTRNMGFMHQQLIEVLSYAMVLTVRCSIKISRFFFYVGRPVSRVCDVEQV